MVRHVHIDFETRSRVDLQKKGAYNYASDPSTQIMCCAFAISKEEPRLCTGRGFPAFPQYIEGLEPLAELAKEKDTVFYAHNASFEMWIWQHILVKRFGFPEIPLERWFCTMAMAYMFNLPGSLKGAADALGLPVRKDMDGAKALQKLCKPRKPTKHDLREWYDDESLFLSMYEYCRTDVKVERAITERLPALPPMERKIWLMDKTMNSEGMQIDLGYVDSAMLLMEEHKRRLLPKFKRLTGVDSPSKRQQTIQWLHNQGFDTALLEKENAKGETILSIDKAKVEAVLGEEIAPQVREVFEICQELNKTSIAKYSAFRELSDNLGVLRDYLVYGRAVTMRWGGGGAQPHNLPKGTIKNIPLLVACIQNGDYDILAMCFPDVCAALSSAIRGVIVARDGHDLMVSDYSAIEARVLLWLAGEETACDMLRRGADLYIDMANTIYERSDITKDAGERQLGKQAVLGCGYGMGPPKFKDTCAGYGIIIDDELAKKAVYAYRDKYKRVKSLWYDLNDCAIKASLSPGIRVYSEAADRKIYFIQRGIFLLMVLPSGRPVVYPYAEVRVVTKDFGEGPVEQQALTYRKEINKKWVRTDTYGGRLVENAVQAIARDIMAIGALNCSERGYALRLMVHDEAISEVPEGQGSISEYERLLCVLPEWAEGCPIAAADGWRGKRYRK